MKLKPHYDVLVVGGGINGAGAAQACAAAGYSCLLVEKQDWAWATSSRSSKLLHGGLRYLQTAQFRLVRECLQERERLLLNAPELARINWFYLPLYNNSQHKPWEMFIGLSLYWLLTGLGNAHGRFRIVPKAEWYTLNGLTTDNLRAVFAYQDGQTDDRLLTQAVKNSAATLGADTRCPMELLSASKTHNGWRVDLHDASGIHTVMCDVIINASGAWVNELIARCGRTRQLPIDKVQGTHLVLEKPISDTCFYLEAHDGRAVFVLPWHGKTLVGTTETVFTGKPENTAPLQGEVDYLLQTVRDHFPQADLTICEQFSGLRVLPASDEKAFIRSRDTQFLDDDGLISIYGGKLTAYRATAEKVLALTKRHLPACTPVADTRSLPLSYPHEND